MTQPVQHVSCPDTAKLVRKALQNNFPETKFSVISRRYAGGASIDVRWTDGPTTEDVDPVIHQYQGAEFDGMIDLKFHRTHWLRDDGSVLVHHDPGTESNRGSFPGTDNRRLAPAMPPDARTVQFAADFITSQRYVTRFDQKLEEAIQWMQQHCHIEDGLWRGRPMEFTARAIVNRRRDQETIQDIFNRIHGIQPPPEQP